MVSDQALSSADNVIERQIRDWLGSNSTERLPSVHQWATALHVGTARVSRVLHALEREGLLDMGARRPVRRVSTQPIRPQPARLQFQRIYDQIRLDIEGGHYPAGSVLPKVGWFSDEYRVSVNTVSRSLALLARDGLIHRNRRNLIVGPSRSTASTLAASGPVILLMQGIDDWWQQTLSNDWLSPFSLGFMQDVQRSATQVMPVFASKPIQPFQVYGDQQIAALVARLDTRLRGVLILGQSWDYHNAAKTSVPQVMHMLARFGRPVVWFDPINEPVRQWVDFNMQEYEKAVADPKVNKVFTRVHFDHEAAMLLALGELYDRGHRRVGIPWFDGDLDALRIDRVDGLVRLAGRFNGLEVVVETGNANPFDPADNRQAQSAPSGHIKRLGREGRERLHEAAASQDPENKRFLRIAPVILSLRYDHRVTALICPNDERARHCYLALRFLGLKVPADLSLVSFDASPRMLHPWPISSVEFGFRYLSSCAYHLIMEDVPVRRDHNALSARCTINHAGSLGPVRRQK